MSHSLSRERDARTSWPSLMKRAAYAALDHDCLTLAQATAYSAMVALFPALIVAAAVITLLPENVPLKFQMAMFFDRILPSTVTPLLARYFQVTSRDPQTTRALLGAFVVSLSGAAGVMATMMEAFRRAHCLPADTIGFWARRARALLLVPLSLVPMSVASGLVVFGHILAQSISLYVPDDIRTPVYLAMAALRWIVALGGSIGIIAVIYHLGTDLSRHLREHVRPFLAFQMDWTWKASLPGATLATILWFLSTLLFGWYVTRFANYAQVYGSLGAAIALLFWLYLIALSVIVGAEFNAQLALERHALRHESAPVPAMASPPSQAGTVGVE